MVNSAHYGSLMITLRNKFQFIGQQNISRNSVISDIVPAFFVYFSENSAGIWIVCPEYYICLCN